VKTKKYSLEQKLYALYASLKFGGHYESICNFGMNYGLPNVSKNQNRECENVGFQGRYDDFLQSF
jgi:hypothetical protein